MNGDEERDPDAAPEHGSGEGMRCLIDLELADSMVLGWERAVIEQVKCMRREVPYAQYLYLDLRWEA